MPAHTRIDRARHASDAATIGVTAAIPRPAASVLVLRQQAATPLVLMGLRGAGHRFMPNTLVFPGGAVDPQDAAAPVATPLQPPVLARLQAGVAADLAHALAVAAARELLEETGLSLGQPPRLDGLDYLCRAVTPAARPLRFDAHFFVVDASELTGALAGSGELEDLRYTTLDAALALDLAVVTSGVIDQLRGWLALSPGERAARARVPVMRERTWQDA